MSGRSAGYPRRIWGRLSKRVKSVLQEGLAPEQMAATICLASAVGTLPLFWGTSLLCVGLAALFRLNQAAMQAVNYLVYPLQIALFLPFFRLGERYLPLGPTVPPQILSEALHGRFLSTVTLLGWATLKALSAWLVTVPPSALLLYPLLVVMLRKRSRRAVTSSEDVAL